MPRTDVLLFSVFRRIEGIGDHTALGVEAQHEIVQEQVPDLFDRRRHGARLEPMICVKG